MRLFIAIRFSRPVLETLKQAQEDLRRQGARGNFSREENLHLTLAFLGETGDAAGARAAMAEACAEGGTFPLTVAGTGRFGELWWAGIAKNRRLEEVERALRTALTARGFVLEKRDFRPHVTLARQVKSPRPLRLAVPERTMTVKGISLMRSERRDGKLIYTELAYEKL